MSYKEEITKAMQLLAKNPRVVFIGQSVAYGGAVPIEATLEGISYDKRIEFPVAEDLQLGICIGLALEGYIPVCIFPRMDFLVLALNQLVNHLDKIEEMSCGQFKPKVIIRASIGSRAPLDPGVQHCQDYTTALHYLRRNIDIEKLYDTEAIMLHYSKATTSERSTILIELGGKMK